MDITDDIPECKASDVRVIRLPDSKVRGANMGPISGRQDPGGAHGGPMNFAICEKSPFYAVVALRNVGDLSYEFHKGVLYIFIYIFIYYRQVYIKSL